jgi:hypothetical protein
MVGFECDKGLRNSTTTLPYPEPEGRPKKVCDDKREEEKIS